MGFAPQYNNTQQQLDAVMELLARQESATPEEIRNVLSCPPVTAHSVLEELIAQGLVQTVGKRSSIRYILRSFEHDPQLVRQEWFDRLTQWFTGGRAESHFSVATQLGLNPQETRATLEEMRKQGLLFGKFVGSMCIYSLRERGLVKQATEEQLQGLIHHKTAQDAVQEANHKPAAARPIRARGLKN